MPPAGTALDHRLHRGLSPCHRREAGRQVADERGASLGLGHVEGGGEGAGRGAGKRSRRLSRYRCRSGWRSRCRRSPPFPFALVDVLGQLRLGDLLAGDQPEPAGGRCRRPCRRGPTGSPARSARDPCPSRGRGHPLWRVHFRSRAGSPSVSARVRKALMALGVVDRDVFGAGLIMQPGSARGRRRDSPSPALIEWVAWVWPSSSCSRYVRIP